METNYSNQVAAIQERALSGIKSILASDLEPTLKIKSINRHLFDANQEIEQLSKTMTEKLLSDIANRS